MYTAEAEASLLAGQPDFVLDAIDNIDTKVQNQSVCWICCGPSESSLNGNQGIQHLLCIALAAMHTACQACASTRGGIALTALGERESGSEILCIIVTGVAPGGVQATRHPSLVLRRRRGKGRPNQAAHHGAARVRKVHLTTLSVVVVPGQQGPESLSVTQGLRPFVGMLHLHLRFVNLDRLVTCSMLLLPRFAHHRPLRFHLNPAWISVLHMEIVQTTALHTGHCGIFGGSPGALSAAQAAAAARHRPWHPGKLSPPPK